MIDTVRLCVTAEGPTLDDLVEEDFGHARYLLIIDPETWKVEVHDNPKKYTDVGHGIMTSNNIAALRPDVVLTGFAGEHGRMKMEELGIKMIMDEEGTVRDAVQGYIRRHMGKK
ncbi:MAG: NifB/NifX family molybdenum-iron cluster-binding protein [Methanomassiliicoccales archaeon]|nr:NifB/NifX family molybdenum-iron cluster-binding protein [Methanomassiliicoccales archaeon]